MNVVHPCILLDKSLVNVVDTYKNAQPNQNWKEERRDFIAFEPDVKEKPIVAEDTDVASAAPGAVEEEKEVVSLPQTEGTIVKESETPAPAAKKATKKKLKFKIDE